MQAQGLAQGLAQHRGQLVVGAAESGQARGQAVHERVALLHPRAQPGRRPAAGVEPGRVDAEFGVGDLSAEGFASIFAPGRDQPQVAGRGRQAQPAGALDARVQAPHRPVEVDDQGVAVVLQPPLGRLGDAFGGEGELQPRRQAQFAVEGQPAPAATPRWPRPRCATGPARAGWPSTAN
ncbi:hypothetical protein K4L06_21600 [Lysobacter sp. BMK333-48F3]|uniref:hypothetical protein n=1 Tax=Lysobacter sp. BMK333-48F3 TaxID=2867962 RepID=UPI001C8B678B|nr:hypothetical protein [Lysobacter sp. BMK333-48F3]MBX9403903.1 hypothetical protein [Lysobacter sp. BMK333-48F3]